MPDISDFGASPSETVSPILPQTNGFTNGFPRKDSSASISDPSTHAQKESHSPASNNLNARSCVTCRKRKVKCDKRHPCSNCNKAAIECIFPGPGRAPRRSRKPPDTELLARLRRLEGVVQNLGRGIDEDGQETVAEAQAAQVPIKPEPTSTSRNGSIDKLVTQEQQEAKRKEWCGKMMTMHEPGKADDHQTAPVKEFGRLVVDEGRSRYVSNKFWNSLSEEITELQDILDDPTDDEEDYPSPDSGEMGSPNHQGFIFSFSSTILSLRNFYPPTEQIMSYWDLYKTNIAPVMKLLHSPHTECMIIQASNDLDHVTKAQEALLFSILYAVVTSIPDNDCMMLLGVERAPTLRKYRFACEQAFARASFLNTQDIMVLQALLLFLTAVRRSDDTRYVWTLTGLLIRLENSLGVHRDGAQFNLSPFETELRRRLWWQTCTLDTRASEDHGCDPSIMESTFDTKFPLNINDEDISPSSTVTPPEHEGATEMTFDLIRYSVSTTVRRLSYAPPGPGPCRTKSASLTLEHKEHMIEELHQYIEKKFLRHLDTSIPLHWVSATVARLIMAKMWLVVHHPLQRSDAGAGLPQETKDRLFITSVEVIEFSRLLETEKATQKWGWLFRTYVQWHALAFILSQLCLRTEGPDVDKAWCVIEGVFDDWGGASAVVSSNQRGMMWKPLRKLMARARQVRQRALLQRAQFPLDGSLGPALVNPFVTQPGPMMNASAAMIDPFASSNPDAYLPNMTAAGGSDFAESPVALANGAHTGAGGGGGDVFTPGSSTATAPSPNINGLNPYPGPAHSHSHGHPSSGPPHPNAISPFTTNVSRLDPWQFGNNSPTPLLENISSPNIDNRNGSNGFDSNSNHFGSVDGSKTGPGMGAGGMNGFTSSSAEQNDTLMTAAEWGGWDDMVREFQTGMGAGVGGGWPPGGGAFENMAL